MKIINSGVYPVMLTPYNQDGSIDYGAVEALTEWYWERGCHGLFAVCLSSDLFDLTLEERVKLTKLVSEKAARLAAADPSRTPMSIVSSGHISVTEDEQARELNAIYEAGADSVVLITNRTDKQKLSDDNWILETERLLSRLPDDITVGFYECPAPYKRLITPRMIDWMKDFGRVTFIKDTCCDMGMIRDRLQRMEGSSIKLFNANAQTFLPSMRAGAAGFSGVMANFNPEFFVWLYENFKTQPEKADLIQNYLCAQAGLIEGGHYPLNVKYLLAERDGISNAVMRRGNPADSLSAYETYCANCAYDLNVAARALLG